MLIDTHMHEMTYSKDSFLKLDEMVRIARVKGLDGICITDHDSMGLKEYAAEYSRRENFPIFTGIEFFSQQGDIVAFGIEEYPKERIPAQDFIDLVKAQGGVCFAAHPFRNNNRGLEDNLRTVHGLDGLEVLNGSTSLEACYKAAEYAEEHLVPVTVMYRRKLVYAPLIFRRKYIQWKNFWKCLKKERCVRLFIRMDNII